MRQYKSEKDTPAYKLFHWLFEVYIPAAYTRSEEELALYGHTSTGNKRYDAELANEKTKVMLPVSDMAMKAQMGCPMQLANPKNAAVIRDLIHEYMQVWADDLEYQYGHLDPERVRELDAYKAREKDILIFEEFAKVVAPVADALPVAYQPNSLLARIRQLGQKRPEGQPSTQPPRVDLNAPTPLGNSLTGGPVRGTAKWR